MQSITPIEIRQKSFEKSFRGYNPDEVNAFLHALAYTWEKMIIQLDELTTALETNSKEVERLQAIENALLKTIKDAEITAHHITQQTQKEAELKVKEAKIEADSLIRVAKEKAKAIEEDSQKKSQYLQKEMEGKLANAQKRVQEAEMYRDTLLQKLQYLAEGILAQGQLIKRDAPYNIDNNKNSRDVTPDTISVSKSNSDGMQEVAM